jgi:hypothetical protein
MNHLPGLPPKLLRFEWQLWESKTVADISALERHKRDPDAISEPDWQTEAPLLPSGSAPEVPIQVRLPCNVPEAT